MKAATNGSFRKLGVPFFGVLIIRILLFRAYIKVPYFRKLPNQAEETFNPEALCTITLNPKDLNPFRTLMDLFKGSL